MNNQQQWIDTVMATATQMRKADAPPFLFTRIEQAISNKQTEVISFGKMGVALAGVLLLLSMNLWILSNKTDNMQYNHEVMESYSAMNYNLYGS